MPESVMLSRVASADPVRQEHRVCHVESSRFTTIALAERRLRIHYHDVGNRSASAPVAVLLHDSAPGTTGWNSFRQNIQPLADAGYRVLVIDLPGWGKSDSTLCAEPRPRLNARCVSCLLDVLGISNPVDVMGSSMGADTALYLALEDQHRVHRLMLIGGGTGVGSLQAGESERMQQMLRFCGAPSIQGLRDLLEISTASTGHLTQEFVQTRFNAIRARPDHLESFVASFRAHPDQFPDFTSRLQEVGAPALLVWGRKDRIFRLHVGLSGLSGLKHAQLRIFENCGPLPHQEQPAAFNKMVLTLLASSRADHPSFA